MVHVPACSGLCSITEMVHVPACSGLCIQVLGEAGFNCALLCIPPAYTPVYALLNCIHDNMCVHC